MDLTLLLFAAEKDYLLKDKAGEDKYGVRLVDALRRAEQLKGSLFKGHTFYVTGRVPVDSKLLKNVVNACCGQVLHILNIHFFNV